MISRLWNSFTIKASNPYATLLLVLSRQVRIRINIPELMSDIVKKVHTQYNQGCIDGLGMI